MPHLLIVEDDELLRDGLCALMTQAGFSVDSAGNGALAQALLEQQRFDGVILDLGLPRVQGKVMDGLDVLRWIRLRLAALPVLILTARDSVEYRVQGLNAGADDYLTKPFSSAELLARLQAMLRRAQLPAFGGSKEFTGTTGARLRVDSTLPRAWLDDQLMELTQREWSLLSLLVAQAGQVVSREDVLAVWQTEALDASGDAGAPSTQQSGHGSNALEVYVHRLRRKLGDCGLNIRNVRGLGYMLERAPS
jgi:DNA-binding response OmpR family regulator